MATRRLVVAARNTDQASFARVLEIGNEARVRESQGWVWTMSHPWFSNHKAIANALQQIPGPWLVAKTEDGDRCYYQTYRDGDERFRLCQEFGWSDGERSGAIEAGLEEALAYDDGGSGVSVISIGGTPDFPTGGSRELAARLEDSWFAEDVEYDDEAEDGDDDMPESDLEGLIEDMEDLGCPLPDEVVARLGALPDSEWPAALVAWQADALIGEFAACAFPHDAETVRGIVDGTLLSQPEKENDLGNLPRLLAHLGFGPEWDNWVADADDWEDEGDESGDSDDTPSWFEEVDETADALDLVPIASGPVAIDVGSAAHLFFPPFWCDPQIYALIVAQHPHLDAGALPQLLSVFPVRIGAGEVALGCCGGEIMTRSRGRHGLRAWFEALPDGARLELRSMAMMGSELTSGHHRFAGTIQDGRWQITESFPACSADALHTALEIVAWVERDADEGFALRDAAEQERLRQAMDGSKLVASKDCSLTDAAIVAARPSRRWVGQALFEIRCGDVWDLEARKAVDAEVDAIWDTFKDEERRERLAHATDEQLHTGASGSFYRADLDSLANEEHAAAFQADLKKYDEALAAIGFEVLDSVVHDTHGPAVMRLYGMPDKVAYAARYLIEAVLYLDLYTAFGDGVSLTTTTVNSVDSCRRLGILYRIEETEDIAELLETHHKGIERLRKKGFEPRAMEPDLDSALAEIDAFLAKRVDENDEEDFW